MIKNTEIIAIILNSLETYALGDIKFLQINKKPIAAFILCTCFIEQLSHFAYGPGGANKTKITKFINEYLNHGKQKKYSAEDLIDILRNKLVHNYSLSDKMKNGRNMYALNFNEPKCHLHKEKEVIHINIDCFVQDIEVAFGYYKSKIYTDAQLMQKTLEQFNRHGILVEKHIQINLP